MMGALIGMALKIGVPARFAKIVVIASLVALLIVGLGVARCTYDRSVIERHDAKREASIAKADRKADTKAAEERRSDDARLAHETAELEKVRTNAPTDLDRRRARARCIRLQQAARRDGVLSPTCA